MKPIQLQITIHPLSLLALGAALGATFLLTGMQGSPTKTSERLAAAASGPPLAGMITPQDLEILSHMSLVDLDDGMGGTCKTIRFSGVNVQIVNGLDATNGYPMDPTALPGTGLTTVNCLGNLIVGYNEMRFPSGNDRTGSHNLIVGQGNNYNQFGGIVGGRTGEISGAFASSLGGDNNRAKGNFSAVLGGDSNFASGAWATVAGGLRNTSSFDQACVNGGRDNVASGKAASVCGGFLNTASGAQAAVGGGSNGVASQLATSVGGGNGNMATGALSSVSGGNANQASGAFSSISGGSGGLASGDTSSIGGGDGNTAGHADATVGGGCSIATTGACQHLP